MEYYALNSERPHEDVYEIAIIRKSPSGVMKKSRIEKCKSLKELIEFLQGIDATDFYTGSVEKVATVAHLSGRNKEKNDTYKYIYEDGSREIYRTLNNSELNKISNISNILER